MKPLRIWNSVRTRIHDAAKAAGRRECLGLLARKPEDATVTSITTLPAVATAAAATAEPIVVKRAAERMAADGLIPAGLWHSHAGFGVFHSGTDHATIRRLMPAMASWSYECAPPPFSAPTLLGRDAAVMPMPDGRVWVFDLVGELIPGSDARLRAEWASAQTRFGKVEHPHQARVEGDCLVLAGRETTLVLRLPPGTTVLCRREDAAVYKVAWLHSLVVNNHGDECVDCIAVHNCAGRVVLDQQESSLIAVPVAEEAAAPGEHPGGNGAGAALALVTTPPLAPWAEYCL